jgi:NCS1 family nucleobase:cation symporter-1
VLGSQWSMSLGALIAAIPMADGGGFLDNQVGFLGELGGGGAAAIAIYLVIVVGKLTVNCLNAYGGFMCLLTTVTSVTRAASVSRAGRVAFIGGFLVVSVLIALLASENFLDNFRQFILALLMVFTPWSAVNLIDYYLVSRERVDVPALYDPDARYGRWNAVALVSYTIGVLAQIPFMAQALYTGPIAVALNGADISWLVGLVVTAAVYYPWAKRTTDVPPEMIYPAGTVAAR